MKNIVRTNEPATHQFKPIGCYFTKIFIDNFKDFIFINLIGYTR